MNIILFQDKTKKDLVAFFHRAMDSVVPSTWIRVIENDQFSSWSGLIADLVKKHMPPSIATAEGHQKQEYQNLQSTKNSVQSVKLQQAKAEKEKATLNPLRI